MGVYKYKTFNPQPVIGEHLRVLAGGDVSTSPVARQMTNNLLDYHPQAIFLGGDIAYDDG